MTAKQHGELVRPGDEFNREPWYQCGQCGLVHGRQLPECDGLRKPFRRAAAMTDAPKMPKPVAHLYHDADKPENAHPLFHSTMLVMPFGRREGGRNETPLITTTAAQAYAEALASARVAQERERWADAVMSELDRNGQAEAIVRCVTGQPPETGKEK